MPANNTNSNSNSNSNSNNEIDDDVEMYGADFFDSKYRTDPSLFSSIADSNSGVNTNLQGNDEDSILSMAESCAQATWMSKFSNLSVDSDSTIDTTSFGPAQAYYHSADFNVDHKRIRLLFCIALGLTDPITGMPYPDCDYRNDPYFAFFKAFALNRRKFYVPGVPDLKEEVKRRRLAVNMKDMKKDDIADLLIRHPITHALDVKFFKKGVKRLARYVREQMARGEGSLEESRWRGKVLPHIAPDRIPASKREANEKVLIHQQLTLAAIEKTVQMNQDRLNEAASELTTLCAQGYGNESDQIQSMHSEIAEISRVVMDQLSKRRKLRNAVNVLQSRVNEMSGE